MQIESRRRDGAALSSPGTPALFLAGGRGAGDYRCSTCGYGVTVRSTLPFCPMCRGNAWERPASASAFDSTSL